MKWFDVRGSTNLKQIRFENIDFKTIRFEKMIYTLYALVVKRENALKVWKGKISEKNNKIS